MSKKLTKAQIAAIKAKRMNPSAHHKSNDEPFEVKHTKTIPISKLINLQRGAKGL